MPALLAIDTSTDDCSLACVMGEYRQEFTQRLPRAHNRHVLAMLAELMDGRPLENLDGIVCGIGPGSFTGLRVAVGVAQGLAWALELPVIPFCSLTSQAQASLTAGSNEQDYLLSVIEAQGDLVYWRLFHRDGKHLQPATQPLLDRVDAVSAKLSRDVLGSLCVVGASADSLAAAIAADSHQAIKIDAGIRPNAADMIACVETDRAGYPAVSPELLQPIYIQNDIGWKKVSEQPRRA